MRKFFKKLFKILAVLCVVFIPVIGYSYLTSQTPAAHAAAASDHSSEATSSADTDYKVDFHYEGLEEERNIAQSYFKEDIDMVEDTMREMGEDEEHIKVELGIDSFDLNGDGQKEILVYLYHSAFCGSHGCSFYILEKKGMKWKEILNLTVYGEGISILKNRSNTYHDLSFIGTNTSPESKIWQWDGKNYVYCCER